MIDYKTREIIMCTLKLTSSSDSEVSGKGTGIKLTSVGGCVCILAYNEVNNDWKDVLCGSISN